MSLDDYPDLLESIRLRDLREEPKLLAEEIVEELSEDYNLSISRNSSLITLVNLSKKLNKKKKKSRMLLKKMEQLIKMCAEFRGIKEKEGTTEGAKEREAFSKPKISSRLLEGLSVDALREKVLLYSKKLELLNSALSTAKEMEYAGWRAEALSKIASSLAQSGMKEEAEKTFKEALSTAKEIEGAVWRAEPLRNIASSQAQSGMKEEAEKTFKEALSTAKEIEDARWRAEALRNIASSQAQSGMKEEAEKTFKEALSTAKEIEDARWRAEILRNIASSQAQSGMFKEALSTAKEIEDADNRAEALRDIASSQAQSGMFKEALSTAKEIEDARWQAKPLSNIASSQAQSGMFKEALSTAKEIENAYFRAEALRNIAFSQAQSGMKEEAEKTFKEALSTAKEIEEAGVRAEALRNIAFSQAQSGMKEEAEKTFKEALSTAKETYVDNEVEALSNIASSQAQSGMKEEAEKTFKEAISTVKEIEDADWQAKTLSNIASSQAQSGMFKEALSTAKEIKSRDWRAEALSNIASSQAQSGMFKEALSTAKEIKSISGRAKALEDIAFSQAQLASKIKAEPPTIEEKRTLVMFASGNYTLLEALGRISTIEEIEDYSRSLTAKDVAIMYEARMSMHFLFDLTDEERTFLFKKYSKELRELLNKGDMGGSLRLSAKILANLSLMGVHSASQILLEEAKRRPVEDRVFLLFAALAETDSYKAKDFVLQAIGSGNLKDAASWALIRRLIDEKYLPEQLRTFYEEKVKNLTGEKKKNALTLLLRTTQLSIRELKVTPDVELLEYLLKNSATVEKIEKKIAAAKKRKEKFKRIKDKDELVEYLSKDREAAMLYFILYGGKTRFALVNNYTSEKFFTALNIAKDLKLHPGPLEEFLSTQPEEKREEIKRRLLEGKFPLGDGTYSRRIRVDVSDSAKMENLNKRTAEVFGRNELGVLLKLRIYIEELEKRNSELADELKGANGLADASSIIAEAEKEYPELVKEVEKRLERNWRKLGEKKVLELSLYSALSNDSNEVKIGEMIKNLEIQRKSLINAVRQQYKSGSIEKMVRDEKIAALQEKAKAKLMRYILEEMVGGTKNDVEVSVFSEWESHMDQIFQDFESLKESDIRIAKEKEVILRWLDKRNDLVECLRFADSAQCCFNSKTYGMDGRGLETVERIVKIWKDPLSFIFQIEDSPGNAIGFVFGSFGLYKGKPVSMLNGVYMEGKTDTAAQSIVNAIENDFSRPLGCVLQIVGARYGGTTRYGKEYSNDGIEVKRLRAIAGNDGNPDTVIYDDLNVGVNKEGTTDNMVWHKKLV